jgi:hypothetical protein
LGLVVCNSSSIRQGERRSRRAKRENGADADLLAHRFALKRRANGFGRTNKIFIGDVQRRTRTSVPRVNELNGTHRGGQRDGRQLEQARGFLDLGFFQPQSIRFHRPEDLFNSPPQSGKAHDVRGRGEFVNSSTNRQCGQQLP